MTGWHGQCSVYAVTRRARHAASCKPLPPVVLIMKSSRSVLALIVAAAGSCGVTLLLPGDTSVAASGAPPLSVEGQLPSLAGATGWLNSPPLTSEGLRGKVVLIDFWTYTCVNWRRTLPYVRAWADKYKSQGLVVVGVHAPEFAFEGQTNNVALAARQERVGYPIALDSGYAVWRAFHNEYWPALYFIDAEGRIRHHHYGEGDYERSERVIQSLLTAAGAAHVSQELVAVEAHGAEAPADVADLESDETYLGYDRAERFASPGGAVPDRGHLYEMPAQLGHDHWALAGDWTITKQPALQTKAGGRVAYRFHARDLNVVMGAATRGPSVRFRITIDGKPPGFAHGVDVDEQGNGAVTDHRLYQLIRQSRPISDRRFEIEFLDSGAEVFSFTFG